MASDVEIEALLERDEYLQVFNNLGHFSLKLNNSNVAGGGVRLDSESAQDSLYLCVNALVKQGQEVATDYLLNAKEAKAMKHLDWARVDETGLDPNKKADLKKIEAIKAARDHYKPVETYYADAEKQFAEFTPDSLSPRLPQVLLPREGSYLSVTPLACAGYCAIVSEAMWGSHSFIKRADFPVGGANPQNIGRHAHYMQKPLVMSAPKEDQATRLLFSVYYNGPAGTIFSTSGSHVQMGGRGR
ncbi:MAG: hypothetical protein MI864_28400 [Pseudomonadales bacterium]|nr:hypothetical protein [Pseudomonadales bacterium]